MKTRRTKIFSKWIDEVTENAANKAVKKYTKEAKRHMLDLKKFFSIELAKVAEIANSRTTKEDVRKIFKEEIAELNRF